MVKILLGADPEFEIVRAGRIVPANQSYPSGTYLGYDGHVATGEFRPWFAPTPGVLAKNLRGLFKIFLGKYPNLSLSVRGDDKALGCHIHFSRSDHESFYPSKKMLSNLDEIYDRVEHLNGEARGDYAGPGNYEAGKSHNGWEYRSFPAGIMTLPQLFEEVVTASWYAVMAECQDIYPPEERKFFYGEFKKSLKKIPALANVSKKDMFNFLPFWGFKSPFYPLDRIDFSSDDTFSRRSKKILIDFIKDFFKTRDGSYICYFFGYKKSRGEYYLTAELHGRTLKIGLPFKMRVDPVFLQKNLLLIKEEISRALEKK